MVYEKIETKENKNEKFCLLLDVLVSKKMKKFPWWNFVQKIV